MSDQFFQRLTIKIHYNLLFSLFTDSGDPLGRQGVEFLRGTNKVFGTFG